jgi:ATP-binding cassette subfamily A (ABC1) protein 3
MKITSYWFGNMIYDYLLYLALAVFGAIMCIVLKVEAYTGEAYLPVCISLLLYGLAYIPFSYIASFVFKDYGNAQAVFYFFTFAIGGLLSTIILVLRLLGGQIAAVGGYIGWGLRIFPSYCFG